jgi:hypothetical protein
MELWANFIFRGSIMAAENGYDEVSASNEESVNRDSEVDDGRPGGSRDPQYTYDGKRRLRIITSVDPTVARKPRLKKTVKRIFKRD